MSPNPVVGGPRFASAVLIGLAFVLGLFITHKWTTGSRTPVFDAGELSTQSLPVLGREVTVTGRWMMTAPTKQGYLTVMRGRDTGSAVCRFEDLPASERLALDLLLGTGVNVAIRGRCDSPANGVAVLRNCRLVD
jgi:hypothetical protein